MGYISKGDRRSTKMSIPGLHKYPVCHWSMAVIGVIETPYMTGTRKLRDGSMAVTVSKQIGTGLIRTALIRVRVRLLYLCCSVSCCRHNMTSTNPPPPHPKQNQNKNHPQKQIEYKEVNINTFSTVNLVSLVIIGSFNTRS